MAVARKAAVGGDGGQVVAAGEQPLDGGPDAQLGAVGGDGHPGLAPEHADEVEPRGVQLACQLGQGYAVERPRSQDRLRILGEAAVGGAGMQPPAPRPLRRPRRRERIPEHVLHGLFHGHRVGAAGVQVVDEKPDPQMQRRFAEAVDGFEAAGRPPRPSPRHRASRSSCGRRARRGRSAGSAGRRCRRRRGSGSRRPAAVQSGRSRRSSAGRRRARRCRCGSAPPSGGRPAGR